MTRFSKVTTCEKESGFLLIEVFRKHFNQQNVGHLDQLRVAFYYLSGIVIIVHLGESEASDQSKRINKNYTSLTSTLP